jgi:hypothetical protein
MAFFSLASGIDPFAFGAPGMLYPAEYQAALPHSHCVMLIYCVFRLLPYLLIRMVLFGTTIRLILSREREYQL